MQSFYHEATQLAETCNDLPNAARTVVLFRVALETGSQTLGIVGALHLVSKLITITLGIMCEDENSSFDDVLAEFEVDDETSH